MVAGHDTPGASLDFTPPGGFDCRWIDRRGLIIETGQQFCGNVGTLLEGQGQRLAKYCLRAVRHGLILHPDTAAQRALHPTGAVVSRAPAGERSRWAVRTQVST